MSNLAIEPKKKRTFSIELRKKLSIAQKNKGKHPKANFDVEIAIDALEYAGVEVQVLIFTGDGDFRYLAEKLISLGATVIFVSTYQETTDHRKRFSTRLKELITEEEKQAVILKQKPRVRFLEIDNFKHLVQKDDGVED